MQGQMFYRWPMPSVLTTCPERRIEEHPTLIQETPMEPSPEKPRLSAAKLFGIILAAMMLTMATGLFLVKFWLFPPPFAPVVLSQDEEQRLERKLERFEYGGGRPAPPSRKPEAVISPSDLKPEAYSEEGASREIRLSEREINGLIAQNTDLAQRMAVDFSKDLVSVKLLIPVDPDFPIMGGKVLKVRAGAGQAHENPSPPARWQGKCCRRLL